jgi:hypothetical protein
MEHRWSTRFPARGNVIVDGPLHGSLTAGVRDISLGGMFIECPSDSFPTNSLLNLSFSVDRGSDSRQFSTEAAVVHVGPNGMGLMFLDDSPTYVQDLRECLPQDENRLWFHGGGMAKATDPFAGPIVLSSEQNN